MQSDRRVWRSRGRLAHRFEIPTTSGCWRRDNRETGASPGLHFQILASNVFLYCYRILSESSRMRSCVALRVYPCGGGCARPWRCQNQTGSTECSCVAESELKVRRPATQRIACSQTAPQVAALRRSHLSAATQDYVTLGAFWSRGPRRRAVIIEKGAPYFLLTCSTFTIHFIKVVTTLP